MTIWQFLNSNVVLLFFGFLFTTIAGALISARLQRVSWERQTRLDLFKKRYDEGTQFLDSLSALVGRRFFALQRFLWAVKDPKNYNLEETSREYFKIVAEWNANLRANRNKIRLLIGQDQANTFLDYDDDERPEDPQSMHYRFVKAGNAVARAKNKTIELDPAQLEIDRINWACSRFLERLTTDFVERANTLNLLQLPDSRDGAQQIVERERRERVSHHHWSGED